MIFIYGVLIVIASVYAVFKWYKDQEVSEKMSKIPLASIRPKHQDVEFLTDDDDDDFEPKPKVSKYNHSKLEDSRSKFQTILKHGKRTGDFNWKSGKSVLSKGIKRKNENKDEPNMIEITDDESEDISPKKENVVPGSSTQNHTSLVQVEAPKEVLIHHRLMISSVSVDFPVRPYPCQTAVMSMLIKGCTNKQNCLLESPTGSGKTLALLCSSLAWQDNYAREVAKDEEKKLKDCGLNPMRMNINKKDDNFYYKENPAEDPSCSKLPENKCCETGRTMMDVDDVTLEESEEDIIAKRPKIPKIYYGSRTHKQIEQIIRELKKTAYRDKRMTILSSREHSCIQMSTVKSKTQLCNELLDPLKKIGCPYYNETNKKTMGSFERLRNLGFDGPWDVEDLVQTGKEMGCCPYFAARELMQWADIIFCPYNYIIDPSIRDTMQLDLKDQIIILDEAHNIEDICRDVASKTIREDDLEQVMYECKHLVTAKDSGVKFTYSNIRRYCEKMLKFLQSQPVTPINNGDDHCSSYWMGHELQQLLDINGLGGNEQSMFYESCKIAILDYNNAKENLRDMWKDPDPKKREKPTITQNTKVILEDLLFLLEKTECPREGAHFKACVTESFVRDFKVFAEDNKWISTDRPHRKRIRMLKLLCLYPGVIFKPLSDLARSIILASGTLAPTNSFQSELGTSFPNMLQANHVIPKDQVYVRGIARGPTGIPLKANYQNTNLFNFQDELGRLLVQVCEAVPHGVLCFFSSYKMMNTQIERWKETYTWNELQKTKNVLIEPRYGGELDEVMTEYRTVIRDTSNSSRFGITGALLFAVFRGKVAEGIDFSDNEARCVLTVGIPFAVRKDPPVDMKMMYNDLNRSKGLLSGGDWYSIQAFRALNQALGRCIRHKNDWGAVLVVDERFVSNSTVNNLPKWVKTMWRNPAQVNLKDELKEFVQIQKIQEEERMNAC